MKLALFRCLRGSTVVRMVVLLRLFLLVDLFGADDAIGEGCDLLGAPVFAEVPCGFLVTIEMSGSGLVRLWDLMTLMTLWKIRPNMVLQTVIRVRVFSRAIWLS